MPVTLLSIIVVGVLKKRRRSGERAWREEGVAVSEHCIHAENAQGID